MTVTQITSGGWRALARTQVGDLSDPLRTVTRMERSNSADLPAMTPRQQSVFDDLLAIGTARPYAPTGIVAELTAVMTPALSRAMSRWPETSLWVSKSTVMSVRRCEAGFLADRAASASRSGKSAAAASGDLAHRALQLSYTHPARPIPEYIDAALAASRSTDEAFEALWVGSDMAVQSDILMAATSRVTSFLDSWPQIRPAWDPRFEEQIQARVAKVTLSARVDLILGRPRPSGQQSMVITDWKSGGLSDHHDAEARYHALVATLSYGVPPFRSLVYSLASGQFTEPDVTASALLTAAQEVSEAVAAVVDLLTERRRPVEACGQSWCACQRTALVPSQHDLAA